MKYAKEHAKDVKVHKFNGNMKNDGKISVLVLGADKAQGGKSRTDSIMIVQYDYVHKNENDVCHEIFMLIFLVMINIKLMPHIHLEARNC